MTDTAPTLVWLRRDLRLDDHPALSAAVARGGPVIPVFVLDPETEALGAAPLWRLGLSLEDLSARLAAMGSRLICRRGPALDVLRALVAETGAGAVHWSRLYDRDAIARDRAVKAGLSEQGIDAQSFPGHLLFEPWTVKTGSGGTYKVFTPMWRAVAGRDPGACLPVPARLPAPETWPAGEDIAGWDLGRAMNRGAAICRPWQCVGEAAARDRLEAFVTERLAGYEQARDLVAQAGGSGLSENLTYGEISPRRCWQRVREAEALGASGAAPWLRQLVWRDFAYQLAFESPDLDRLSWRPEWRAFPWSQDADSAAVTAWKQGRTGVPFVDAAMREMYVTGQMHNRARMIVASYLTKHLLTDWRIGLAWFADCLTDWDPAANAMGWQWSAGSGPDATPYFRVFNPDTQARKFDPEGRYARRWIAEGQRSPSATALSYFDAIPRRWGLSPTDRYPLRPIMGLAEGRARALEAYERFKTARGPA